MVRTLIKKIGRRVFGRGAPTEAPQASPEATPRRAPSQNTRDGNPPRRRRRKRRRNAPNDVSRESEAIPWSIDAFQVPEKEGASRFHDFGLPEPIMHAIHDLGFQYCTPIQAKVLSHAREGRNIAGKAQTGTGKTAAFVICIFAQFWADPLKKKRKPGTPRALVIAPTRELVLQIVKDAKDLGTYGQFHCVALYGGMDMDQQRRELHKQPVDLVAATPGRLLDFNRRRDVDLKGVEVLVIDEADRMLDMGFIPDVRRIIRATPPRDQRMTMLFSATLSDDVLRLASQWMTDPIMCEVDPEKVTVDTVNQIVYVVDTKSKFKLLCNLLAREEMSRVLIFANRRDSTKRLADRLNRHSISCSVLSGAVRQEKRLKILESFRAGKTRVVVATDVAGRGIHVENVTHVINYELPCEPEDYVHRIGRTARVGLEGTAISFACEEESFVIPEIEEYIGHPLPCTMPDLELLELPRSSS